jgi:diguanylate cyclase (GGDEF)-like protein/PAS domain S-box-containing protein
MIRAPEAAHMDNPRDAPGGRAFLCVGPDQADSEGVRRYLSQEENAPPQVEWEKTLASALTSLKKKSFDAILLDFPLLDGRGPDTLEVLRAAAADTPIVLIASPEDEQAAKAALKWGVADYLVRGLLEVRPLSRTLNDLVRRKSLERDVAAEQARANASERTLFAEKERAEVTLNSIGDAVLCTDNAGRVTYLNLVAERMTGWSREEAIGRPAVEIFHIIDSKTREPARDPLQLAVSHDMPMGLMANSLLIRKDGLESVIEDSVAPIHDHDGKVAGAVVVFHDVDEARAMALKMSHLAQYDFLTDLPNRALFNDRLDQAIAGARRHQRQLGVLFLDCDNFKEINDNLGHAVGDLVLQSIAKRLVSAVRSSDTVSRQGGDEFVILLSELEKTEDAAICARKIIAALTKPHRIGQQDLHVNASIGSAIFPDDGRNAEILLKCADMALYEAKQSGRNTYRAFRPKMMAREVARHSVEGSLLQALERKQFCLHYQPRVEMATGKVLGVEALIRWNHPERGLIPPAEFVPIAEDSGLIVPIGRWVLGEACRQAAEWRKSGLGILSISVNVSPIELRSLGFLDRLNSLLAENGIARGVLELELTERVLMRETEAVGEALQALEQVGVRLALDDFGTGFSNLSYLKRFPIGALKIDASFVRDLSTKVGDRTLIAAIIGLARTLGRTVVAEGIETEAQLGILRELGCEEGQGFLFCRPLPANDLVSYLKMAGRKTSKAPLEGQRLPSGGNGRSAIAG